MKASRAELALATKVRSLEAGLPLTRTAAGASAWAPLPFAVNWANIGGANQAVQYCKDANGFIRLRGAGSCSVVPTPGDTIGTLPVRFRPAASLIFPVVTDTGLGRVDIANDGRVLYLSGGHGFVSFEMLTFDAR